MAYHYKNKYTTVCCILIFVIICHIHCLFYYKQTYSAYCISFMCLLKKQVLDPAKHVETPRQN